MAEEVEEKIRRILRPAHDSKGREAEIKSLDVERAVPIVIAILTSEQEAADLRQEASMLLAILKDERAIAPLLQTLNASDPVLRARSAIALGWIAGPREDVVRQIISKLDDADYFVRESAARTLGSLKSPEALPALARMSERDSEPSNREEAQKAIDEIKGVA